MKDIDKEKIFNRMFKENRDRIYRLCFAYLIDKNEVDDLFQEIMINVWNSLEKFREESKISTWIYRIAVNSAFLFNKKTKKNRDIFLNFSSEMQTHEDKTDNKDQEVKKQLLNKLNYCISSLEKQDRIIISLQLEGLKYSEIADITGLSANHVGVKINRIKPVILKLMKEERYG